MTQGTIITNTHYLAGGFQYKNSVLDFFPQAEGYVKNTSGVYSYVFNYTDHLGNIRVSYSDTNNSGSIQTNEILEENHYYPFGLKHSGYNGNNSQPNYQYKYNGKELQDELGLNMYDYGARNYDPALGRWMNVDPLAETSRRWSPYTYVYNNPLRFVDPDGMQADDLIIKGEGSDKTFAQLQKSTSLTLTKDNETGKVTATGEATSKADKELLALTTDSNITVNLNSTLGYEVQDGSGDYLSTSGSFDGSTVNEDGSVTANQTINPDYAEIVDNFEGTPVGVGVLHEALEGYQEGKRALETQTGSGPGVPGTEGYENYVKAHVQADRIDPRHKRTADSFTGTNPKTGEQARVLEKPNGQTKVLYKIKK